MTIFKHVFIPSFCMLALLCSFCSLSVASAQATEQLLGEALSQIDTQCAAEEKRVSRSLRRMRRSALLPTLRLSGRRGQGIDHTQSQGTTERVGLSLDDSYSITLSLSFDLGKLVFQQQELAWRKQWMQLAKRCDALVERVFALYETAIKPELGAVGRRVVVRMLKRLAIGKFWL